MLPIVCALAIMLLLGCIGFCAVIGGYRHPDEWWGEGGDPEMFPRVPNP